VIYWPTQLQEGLLDRSLKVVRSRMASRVALVVTTHNRKDKVIRLLGSISQSSFAKRFLKTIVVDDASTDGTFEEVRSLFPKVLVSRTNQEVFLAKARNIGAQYSKAKYVLFVDDDMVIEGDLIGRLIAFMEEHPDYGIAGPVVTYFRNQNKIWHAGVLFRPRSFAENRYIWQYALLSNVKREGFIDCSYVPGIFMVRKKILNKLQGFDYRNFPFSFEDLDLALRAQSTGFKTACVLSALAFHDIDEQPIRRSLRPMRAFHHGRSRTRFYMKYLKWKLLWVPAYFLGFMVRQLQNNNLSFKKRLQLAFSYLKGISYGIARVH